MILLPIVGWRCDSVTLVNPSNSTFCIIRKISSPARIFCLFYFQSATPLPLLIGAMHRNNAINSTQHPFSLLPLHTVDSATGLVSQPTFAELATCLMRLDLPSNESAGEECNSSTLPFGPDHGEYFGSETFRQGQIVGPRPRVAPSTKDPIFHPIHYRRLFKPSEDQDTRIPTDIA